MKLITLNIWGGKIYDPLIDFLKDYSREIDIFCFQELLDNPSGIQSRIMRDAKQDINQDIKMVLPDFDEYLAPYQDHEEIIGMYIRKSIPVRKTGDVFVYRWRNALVGNDATTYGINLQYAEINQDNKKYTICNLHGHWTSKYKGDNPARLEQSRNIRKFLDNVEGPKILCGDFNLDPETESMKILEATMKNLVKEYGINSTRSGHYTGPSRFADYILVSPEIKVKDFKVLQDIVSDHLPVFLEFE